MVKSVKRAFLILNLLGENGQGLGVNEIARLLQLNSTTTHRLLRTLISVNAVQQDPKTRQYFLGPKLVWLGSAVLERYDFIQTARTFLTELSSEIQELTSLGILDKFELVYIDYVDASDRGLRMTPPIGRREYAHCTALGKVLLAHLSEDDLETFFKEKELPRLTDNTITTKNNLRKALEEIRNQGYSFDREETESGICCVSAPIFNTSGDIVAAVSISGPKTRMHQKGFETHLRDKIVLTAAEISKQTLA